MTDDFQVISWYEFMIFACIILISLSLSIIQQELSDCTPLEKSNKIISKHYFFFHLLLVVVSSTSALGNDLFEYLL